MRHFEITCPACHGAGGDVEPILDDGTGPWESCGFCNGTGKIKDRHLYYETLGYLSSFARWKKKEFDARKKADKLLKELK